MLFRSWLLLLLMLCRASKRVCKHFSRFEDSPSFHSLHTARLDFLHPHTSYQQQSKWFGLVQLLLSRHWTKIGQTIIFYERNGRKNQVLIWFFVFLMLNRISCSSKIPRSMESRYRVASALLSVHVKLAGNPTPTTVRNKRSHFFKLLADADRMSGGTFGS